MGSNLNGLLPGPRSGMMQRPRGGLFRRRNICLDSLLRPHGPHRSLRAGTKDGDSGRNGSVGLVPDVIKLFVY